MKIYLSTLLMVIFTGDSNYKVVGFSFIDISVERVTGLENDADETI
jgi:hypothetical protein